MRFFFSCVLEKISLLTPRCFNLVSQKAVLETKAPVRVLEGMGPLGAGAGRGMKWEEEEPVQMSIMG